MTQPKVVEEQLELTSVAIPGNPTTTTQVAGNNSTRIATTAFVQNAVSAAPSGGAWEVAIPTTPIASSSTLLVNWDETQYDWVRVVVDTADCTASLPTWVNVYLGSNSGLITGSSIYHNYYLHPVSGYVVSGGSNSLAVGPNLGFVTFSTILDIYSFDDCIQASWVSNDGSGATGGQIVFGSGMLDHPTVISEKCDRVRFSWSAGDFVATGTVTVYGWAL